MKGDLCGSAWAGCPHTGRGDRRARCGDERIDGGGGDESPPADGDAGQLVAVQELIDRRVRYSSKEKSVVFDAGELAGSGTSLPNLAFFANLAALQLRL